MALIDKDQAKAKIERIISRAMDKEGQDICEYILDSLDAIPEQPVSDHHEIEVEFRGEKVTISREFYRDGEMNYSTSEQDDNAIWSALRAWCEKKGITPFELYPKQSEQPVEGLEEATHNYVVDIRLGYSRVMDETDKYIYNAFKAGAEWQKKRDDIETADLLAIAHLQGMEQQKSKMLEDAVEGYVNYYEDSGGILMAEAQVGCPYHNGDKVKIIVIKED